MENYHNEYIEFALKHGASKEFTEMQNGITYKQIVFEDNSEWYEVYGDVIESKELDIHGILVKVDVKLFKIEYWTTDNATSKFAYQVNY